MKRTACGQRFQYDIRTSSRWYRVHLLTAAAAQATLLAGPPALLPWTEQ